MSAPTVRLLRGARLRDGRVVDVAVDEARGVIVGVRAAEPREPKSDRPEKDLRGYLLLPAAAEPHAHLDKALTADLVANPRGDLLGAIDAWLAFVRTVDADDMARRAKAAALELVANGVTAVRTHTNVAPGWFDAVKALLQVRDELADVMSVQVVALTTIDICGGERAYRETITEAISMDPAVLVGGCPHLDTSPQRAIDLALEVAGTHGRAVDLHMDEQLDPNVLTVPYLAQRVSETGFPHPVAASHCVSLGMQAQDVQRSVAEAIAEAGVSVVTLPQTNLYLQGREQPTATPRGLTALRALLDAEANLAAGGDNVRDPFNHMGRSDPFETASLLVMAGHLRADEALEAVTHNARHALGLPTADIAPGAPAELLAVRGASVADAIARADAERIVWHRGRIVAETAVARAFPTAKRQDSSPRAIP